MVQLGSLAENSSLSRGNKDGHVQDACGMCWGPASLGTPWLECKAGPGGCGFCAGLLHQTLVEATQGTCPRAVGVNPSALPLWAPPCTPQLCAGQEGTQG